MTQKQRLNKRNFWDRSGENGNRTLAACSASQELNHYTIAAPIVKPVSLSLFIAIPLMTLDAMSA